VVRGGREALLRIAFRTRTRASWPSATSRYAVAAHTPSVAATSRTESEQEQKNFETTMATIAASIAGGRSK
jgi:hypothetical protein